MGTYPRELMTFTVLVGEMLRLASSVRKNLAFYRGKCPWSETLVAVLFPMAKLEVSGSPSLTPPTGAALHPTLAGVT